MGAAREATQADFDLERFIEIFDEAMTSKDPRVIETLRSLMMIVTLTRPESRDAGIVNRQRGPLRRLYDDIYHLNNRLSRVEEEQSHLVRQLTQAATDYKYNYPYEKYSMKAAAEMAAQIDIDLINQLKVKAKGLYEK